MRIFLRSFIGSIAVAAIFATAAHAQTESVGLSPTLTAIKASKTVRLGYRESSAPFSFLDHSGQPIGYSLELCEAVVEEIGIATDTPDIKIAYVKVTSDSRIPAVVQNQIDLECGSTTANAERGKQVAFSPLMFVAGTKLMVPKTSTLSQPQDLKKDDHRHQRHHQRAGLAHDRRQIRTWPVVSGRRRP